jgi:hypothetical protein
MVTAAEAARTSRRSLTIFISISNALADEENAVLATAPDKTGIVRPTPLYDWLYELAGDVKPVMIGIASSANVFAGNENVRTEVQQFIRLLRGGLPASPTAQCCW